MMSKDSISIRQKNAILLEKAGKILVNPSPQTKTDSLPTVLAMQKNIEDLGFLFSKDLYDTLTTLPRKRLITLYREIVPVLKKMVGDHVEHKPFYKNFPHQVAAMDEIELQLNALLHYWTFGTWIPEYKKKLRFPLEGEEPRFRWIGLARLEDFDQIFIDLISSSSSISAADEKLLGWYLEHENSAKLNRILPETIPFKEIQSIVLAGIFDHHGEDAELIHKFIKTPTDVLRLVTALSDGDVSLAENTVFINLERRERRLILSLLEDFPTLQEELRRHKDRWLRVGEILHPGDYAARFPRVFEAFRAIRKNLPIETFYSRLEACLERNDFENALALLRQRPGELARRLDLLARRFPDQNDALLAAFGELAGQVSARLLLQLIAHFKNRHNQQPTRIFFPKGKVSKAQVVPWKLDPISADFSAELVAICERDLIRRYQTLPPLGKVYLDPALKEIMVPLSQRSASKSLKTYERGSRFALAQEIKVLRAFIHWKNPTFQLRNAFGYNSYSERIDIDLSVGLYDRDWNYLRHISYTNLREKELGAYHSGDIVDAPDGASEFIDLDIRKMLAHGVRYAVFYVLSFSRQNFNHTPECFFGWMYRQHPRSGEIFEPKLVENKIDLASETQNCLPVMFDLESRQAIWLDAAVSANLEWNNNIESIGSNAVLIAQGILNMSQPNLYDLFRLHALARGELVETAAEADVRFVLEETHAPEGESPDGTPGAGSAQVQADQAAQPRTLTPFQTEKILAEFV